jgi:sugar phosphate permease
VVTFPLCGYLISLYGWESGFYVIWLGKWFLCDYGWESGFYVIDILTMIWVFFWCFLVFDTPDKHPRISLEKKLCIKESRMTH